MSRSIVITSGKGGAGKTTVTANLGAYLALNGQKVVMLDVDIGLNNLDVVLGIESKIVYDIVDVIEGRCRLKQALIEDAELPNLSILPSCHSYDRSKINGQNIRAVVNALKANFDFILIDCPAGIETGFHRAVQAAGEAIIVVTPHISSIRDADKAISILRSYDLESMSLVVNRARGDLMAGAETLDINDIGELCRCEMIGVIPEDDHITKEQSLGHLCSKNSDSGKAFDLLAKNIISGDAVIYDCTAKYKGFLGKLRRSIKKMG